MKNNLQIQALIAFFAAAMMLSSCGNIDIVKRKYRPGFHVDVTKKNQKTKGKQEYVIADKRSVSKIKPVDLKPIMEIPSEVSDKSLLANTQEVAPVTKSKSKNDKRGSLMSVASFKNLSFDRKMKTIKNEIFKPKPRRGGTEWMKWVAFSAGIAAMAFGFMALLFAFLFTSSYLIWLAMILSAAAIVFAILYKNGNGTDPKSRLGLIFGIIGGGLAIIALIVWAIWVGLAVGAVL